MGSRLPYALWDRPTPRRHIHLHPCRLLMRIWALAANSVTGALQRRLVGHRNFAVEELRRMPAIVHQMRTLRRIHILACPSSVRYGPSSWGTFIGMAALPAPSRSRFGGTPTWGWLDKIEELRRGAALFFLDDGTSDAGAQPGESMSHRPLKTPNPVK
jgi:hypothetical protein